MALLVAAILILKNRAADPTAVTEGEPQATTTLRQALGALREHLNERYRLGRTSTMSPGSPPDWSIQAQRPLSALFGEPEQLTRQAPYDRELYDRT